MLGSAADSCPSLWEKKAEANPDALQGPASLSSKLMPSIWIEENMDVFSDCYLVERSLLCNGSNKSIDFTIIRVHSDEHSIYSQSLFVIASILN